MAMTKPGRRAAGLEWRTVQVEGRPASYALGGRVVGDIDVGELAAHLSPAPAPARAWLRLPRCACLARA